MQQQSLAELRSKVAIVLQKNLLFSGTILENLRWGNPEASQAEVEAACRSAAAHDFYSQPAAGLSNNVGAGRREPFRWAEAAFVHCPGFAASGSGDYFG